MRKALWFVLLIGIGGCMQKQADGTYRVADTAKARDNAVRSGAELKQKIDAFAKSDAGKKLKAQGRELGRLAQEKLGKAAQTAGAKLQEAGKKAEQDSKKSH